MSAPPRWQRRPEARSDELLDAAMRCFAARGLATTTVAEIAQAAGVAKGSVYRYFATKEALLSALKDRFFARMIEKVGSVVESMPGAGFAEVMDAAIDATVRFLFDQGDLVELWCRETPPEGSDEFSRGITTLTSMFEVAIAGAVDDGLMSCADPAATALLLVYATEGAATHAILHRTPVGCEEIIGAAQAMTRRTLGLPLIPERPAARRPNAKKRPA